MRSLNLSVGFLRLDNFSSGDSSLRKQGVSAWLLRLCLCTCCTSTSVRLLTKLESMSLVSFWGFGVSFAKISFSELARKSTWDFLGFLSCFYWSRAKLTWLCRSLPVESVDCLCAAISGLAVLRKIELSGINVSGGNAEYEKGLGSVFKATECVRGCLDAVFLRSNQMFFCCNIVCLTAFSALSLVRLLLNCLGGRD